MQMQLPEIYPAVIIMVTKNSFGGDTLAIMTTPGHQKLPLSHPSSCPFSMRKVNSQYVQAKKRAKIPEFASKATTQLKRPFSWLHCLYTPDTSFAIKLERKWLNQKPIWIEQSKKLLFSTSGINDPEENVCQMRNNSNHNHSNHSTKHQAQIPTMTTFGYCCWNQPKPFTHLLHKMTQIQIDKSPFAIFSPNHQGVKNTSHMAFCSSMKHGDSTGLFLPVVIFCQPWKESWRL